MEIFAILIILVLAGFFIFVSIKQHKQFMEESNARTNLYHLLSLNLVEDDKLTLHELRSELFYIRLCLDNIDNDLKPSE